MLDKLKKGSSVVSQSMESTKTICQHTAETTSRVMSSLDLMAKSMVETNDLAAQIATAAEEQSTVTEEINRNMAAIQEMIRTLSDNGEDTVSSAHRLTKLNTELVQIVGQFRLQ